MISLVSKRSDRFRALAAQIGAAGVEMRGAWEKQNPHSIGGYPRWPGFIKVGGEFMGEPTVQIEYEDMSELLLTIADYLDSNADTEV